MTLNTVVELKALAKSLGIKVTGLKKAELKTAIDNYYRDARKAAESAPKRMSAGKRIETYTAQRNGGKLSARQARRVRKNENRLKG